MEKTQIDSGCVLQGSTDSQPELRSIGDFRILRRLGEGGMGAVYLGYHEQEGLQVAVKVLNDQLASNQGFIDRFYREAKSGALLNHPNIVRSITAGQDAGSGKHYLVLEYVDGLSVHALLSQQGRLRVGDAVHIALDVARGLEHAHSRNLVHRDIKPDNILLTRSGVAKLVDLGLAKRVDEASHLTGTRQSFGTTPYMPYEQALKAKNADGRSDIYALGATLYHLVTGCVPFPANSHVEVVEKKNRGDYAAACSLNPEVPRALDVILARMLARQPRERYQTVSELIVDLQRSGLSAVVPSFADPEHVQNDTWVQAQLQDNAVPTRMDHEPPVRRREDVWLLRYRNRGGRLRRARATTTQIVERLQQGRLPSGAEVSRAKKKDFRPPAQFPEFHAALRTAGPPDQITDVPVNAVTQKTRPVLPSATRSAIRRLTFLIIVGGAMVAVVAGLLALLSKLQ